MGSPVRESGSEGPEEGWLSAGEQTDYLSRPANVRYVVIDVGNMIDSGQPQRRQLICRHRLAP